MNDAVTLARLRSFLLGLTAVMLLGAIVELILAGHTESPMQLVPFALCGAGLVALATVRLRPGRGSILTLRVIMATLALGSLLGMSQHFLSNLELARETRPTAAASQLLVATVTGGAPLLAPGLLAAAAAIAIAATYGNGGSRDAAIAARPRGARASESGNGVAHIASEQRTSRIGYKDPRGS